MGGLGSRQRVSASLQIFALTAEGNVPGVEGNFSGWELSGENMSEGGNVQAEYRTLVGIAHPRRLKHRSPQGDW